MPDIIIYPKDYPHTVIATVCMRNELRPTFDTNGAHCYIRTCSECWSSDLDYVFSNSDGPEWLRCGKCGCEWPDTGLEGDDE